MDSRMDSGVDRGKEGGREVIGEGRGMERRM